MATLPQRTELCAREPATEANKLRRASFRDAFFELRLTGHRPDDFEYGNTRSTAQKLLEPLQEDRIPSPGRSLS
jgi:hypothetical protein